MILLKAKAFTLKLIVKQFKKEKVNWKKLFHKFPKVFSDPGQNQFFYLNFLILDL